MSRCLACDSPMTWRDQRRQFARLLERGFTADEAKQLTPRCQKCMTILLRERTTTDA